jgi:cell filamentation protein
VTFDPFGDLQTRGYLRNVARTRDAKIIRQLEHSSFTTGLDAAFAKLAARKRLSYDDVLGTHQVLFEAVYPWAGQDRMANASGIGVSKGSVLFARPDLIRRTIDYALEKGQNKPFMMSRPGEIMGHLAYGHPFLDGNGRTIMVVHSVLAQRAGFGIDWAATDKTDYLNALSEEIENPKAGALNAYLKPFITAPLPTSDLAAAVVAAPGLDGQSASTVAGVVSDPALQERYRLQELAREEVKK